MANERQYRPVSQTFSADGTAKGQVQVSTARGFKVKAKVLVESNTQETLTLEVKSIPSETLIEVGPCGSEMEARADLSSYLVSDGAVIKQGRQKRPPINLAEIDRATYEEEPTVARRSALVDEFGNLYGDTNPMPVASFPGLIKSSYDSVQLGYDVNQNLTTAAYYYQGALVATVTLTYDVNQNLTGVTVA